MNLKAFRVSKIFLSYSELASKNKKVLSVILVRE